MRLEQLTCKQLDDYERLWTRLMLASGAALVLALFGLYYYPSGGTGMFVCGIVAAVSFVVGAIAAVKLHELGRGIHESDREARGDVHSALGGVDD